MPKKGLVSSPTRPQLGQLLLEKGLLTEEELDRALELHEQTGKPLGEIITDDLRLVSVAAMRDVLVLQKRWRPLGQMLVSEDGFRELAQRCAALAPRVAAVLEGGYNLVTLPRLVDAALEGFTS